MSISSVRSGQVLGRRFVPIVKLNYAQVLWKLLPTATLPLLQAGKWVRNIGGFACCPASGISSLSTTQKHQTGTHSSLWLLQFLPVDSNITSQNSSSTRWTHRHTFTVDDDNTWQLQYWYTPEYTLSLQLITDWESYLKHLCESWCDSGFLPPAHLPGKYWQWKLTLVKSVETWHSKKDTHSQGRR